MEHLTKQFDVLYKDEGEGTLEGYASTWIKRPDSYGDIVKEGAFTETLKERWKGGKNIPLLWAHQMDNLSSYIGKADADEDEKGLHFIARFDDTAEAQRVREMYKDGRLSKFSFAYDVLEAGPVTLEDGIKANELRKLDLFEISCVLVPANDDAGVVDVKSEVPQTAEDEPEEEKSGRRNSAKDADALKQAIELIKGVLGELDDIEEETTDKGEDDPEANAGQAEEQTESNQAKESLLTFIKEQEVKP